MIMMSLINGPKEQKMLLGLTSEHLIGLTSEYWPLN